VVLGVHSAKFSNERLKENINNAILRYGIEHPVIVDNDYTLSLERITFTSPKGASAVGAAQY
jgi:hypothetical protein